MKSWKNALILAAALVIVVAGAAFGYSKYSAWRAAQVAQEAALADAKKILAEQVAGAEYLFKLTYDDSNMTYAQLFERADERSKKMDDAVISIQASDLPEKNKMALAAYVGSLSNAVKSLTSQYRKSLAADSALEAANSSRDNYQSTPYNEYSDGWERRQVKDAANDAVSALTAWKDSIKEFGTSIKSVQSMQRKYAGDLLGAKLVDGKILTKALTRSEQNLKSMS